MCYVYLGISKKQPSCPSVFQIPPLTDSPWLEPLNDHARVKSARKGSGGIRDVGVFPPNHPWIHRVFHGFPLFSPSILGYPHYKPSILGEFSSLFLVQHPCQSMWGACITTKPSKVETYLRWSSGGISIVYSLVVGRLWS